MKTISLFCFSIMLSIISFATTYYCDPSSTASTANGALATPWKTIAQVNSGTTGLNPGDLVLFKRGQMFSGRLTINRSGSAGNPIKYGAYGTGALPQFNNNVSGVVTMSGVSYVVFDCIQIIDNSMASDVTHNIQANISYAITINNSPNCTISNCDISLVGVGIQTTGTSNNTLITHNYIHNMRMVKNTPTSVNANDDYGANPMVIGTNNNTITYNRFEECWAKSYDYGYDGGAVEMFGSVANNLIMYNIAINCNGFTEIGSNGGVTNNNNLIAYNKIINCGLLGTLQNAGAFATKITNLHYYNNTVIETVKQYSKPGTMFWEAGTGTAGFVTLKNNIFWLASGTNFISNRFTNGEINHSNNIWRMSSGSLGLTPGGTETSNSGLNLFLTTAGLPDTWDLRLIAACTAVNFGVNVSLLQDYAGNVVSTLPDAGALEYTTTITPPPPPPVIIPPIVIPGIDTLILTTGKAYYIIIK